MYEKDEREKKPPKERRMGAKLEAKRWYKGRGGERNFHKNK